MKVYLNAFITNKIKQMIIEFDCIHCDNKDPQKAVHYDGAVGYEAIYCRVCGCYVDHFGWHRADESSERFKKNYVSLLILIS